MESNNPWNVLGVTPGSSKADIKKAYNRLMVKYHPDQFPEGSREKLDAQERFKEVNSAYQKIKSGNYNPHSGNASTEDIFRDFFGGSQGSNSPFGNFEDLFAGAGNQGFSFRFNDNMFNQSIIRKSYSCKLEDTLNEQEVSVNFQGKNYKVKIPSGIFDGQSIQVDLGRNINLILTVRVDMSSSRYFRIGNDLWTILNVDRDLKKTDIELPNGQSYSLSISSNMKLGDEYRINNQGFSHDSYRKGDLIILLNIGSSPKLERIFKGYLEYLSVRS